MYSAFIALSVKLLKKEGQLVAITPRSFTNGPYFKAFRLLFTAEMSFDQIHVFNSRNRSFSEDEVLQENIIFHAFKEKELLILAKLYLRLFRRDLDSISRQY